MAIERLEYIRGKKDRELAKLLQELIRIPSWVPDDPSEEELKWTQNENHLVDYIEEWLKTHTTLEVERQKLAYGRFNLIATKGKPTMILLGHLDTVRPSEGAPYDQLAAEIHEGKIWGRGAADMKSGLASVMQAVEMTPDANNLMVVFYADEEYDFLGMKAFVDKYSWLRPKVIISADGSDFKFGHGCRGLIELRGRIIGETGHPASGSGKNAIWGTYEGLAELRRYLETFDHPVMGKPSFNLAYQLGGAKLPESIVEGNYVAKVGQAGNVVPDINEFVIDIRPSSPDLTLDKVVEVLEAYFADKRFAYETIQARHNLGAWYSDIKSLEEYVAVVKEAFGQDSIELENLKKSGYLDLQMLWEATGRPLAFMVGAGKHNMAHSPMENIEIDALARGRDVFVELLKHHSKN